MVLKVIILALAGLGLIFVIAPFFNYAVFDFQCQVSGCSREICKSRTIIYSDAITPCDDLPEYGCNKNCGVRSFRCSFDEEIKNKCLKCVQDCKIKYILSESVSNEIDTCFTSCYNEIPVVNST